MKFIFVLLLAYNTYTLIQIELLKKQLSKEREVRKQEIKTYKQFVDLLKK